jgi:tetratricopeptide (TPR) repeat protein
MLRYLHELAAVSCTRLWCWLLAWACLQLPAAGAQAQLFQLSQPLLAQAETSQADLDARNTTMARALFDEGLRYLDAEQWDTAQDRFARVLTLRYSAVAAYNLGLAQARLGRGVVAAAALRRLLADAGLDAKVRDRATALLADVEAHFAWLTLRVVGDCKGCMVYVNQDQWPWAAVGVPVPIDAGHYSLRLRVGERVLAEERVDLAQAARVEASLLASPNAQQPGSSEEPATSPDAPSTPARSSNEFNLLTSGWFWGAMGVFAVGAATAVVLATR